jgi:hypothetical protein
MRPNAPLGYQSALSIASPVILENDPQAPATAVSDAVMGWVYAQAFRVLEGSRDANGALLSASVVWPDSVTGSFTATTVSTDFPGAVDAYTVTRVQNGITQNYTQPAVTRDPVTGAVTAQPAIIIS